LQAKGVDKVSHSMVKQHFGDLAVTIQVSAGN
jgi:hypothetical protein